MCGAFVVGPAQASQAAPAKTQTAAKVKVAVTIEDFTYMPDPITIVKGTKVKWKNIDSTAHTVTFKDFQSPVLGTGRSYSHKFTTVGTFPYHCSLHPQMTGTVTVTAS